MNPSNGLGNRHSPYTWVASHAIFPLHEWVKGHDSVAVRRRLEHSQWLSPAELAAQQVTR